MKLVIIVFLLVVVSLLSGCIDSPQQTEYHYQDGSSFTLFKDNTFVIHMGTTNRDYSGVYRLENDTLLLIYPIGHTERMTRIETGWLDKDGWVWK